MRILVIVVAALVLVGSGLGLWFFQRRAPQSQLPAASTAAPPVAATRVVSLGRIQPATTIRVAGPARPSVVVGALLVEQGSKVTAGQEIARMDSVGTEEAEVQVWRAEVSNAEQELARARNLLRQGVTSRAVFDQAQSRRDTAVARLEQAKAELARSHVRAPIDGVVLEVFARDGERVGPEGIVEIANTATMLAVAEVPESQIDLIRLGQPAWVSTPSVTSRLTGRVAQIGRKVRQQEVVSADPSADLDARIIEVEVALDDPAAVAALTNLRVEVEIDVRREATAEPSTPADAPIGEG
jgi:HlyD family secretion protein